MLRPIANPLGFGPKFHAFDVWHYPEQTIHGFCSFMPTGSFDRDAGVAPASGVNLFALQNRASRTPRSMYAFILWFPSTTG